MRRLLPAPLLLAAALASAGCYEWGRGGLGDDDSAAGTDDDDFADDDDSTGGPDDDDAAADPCAGDPGAEDVGIDDDCRVDLVIESDPDLQILWQISEFDPEPCFREVMMTPLVVPLTDDDGDGVASDGDARAIVFNTFCGSDYSGAGLVRALRGDGSGELWVQTDPAWRIQPDSQLAAADLDGDGWPEIVAVSADHRLMALDRFGVGLWISDATVPSGAERGGAFLTDLGGDGAVEIVYGNQIYDAGGALLATGAAGRGSNAERPEFPTSFTADVDLDGVQEIVVGNALYDASGNTIWANGQPDGFPAVGNFDDDPEAEIAVVSSNQVRVQDTNGAILFGPVSLAGSGSGGPPTVADFDGDGLPEIGVANLAFYTMLDTDLTQLWANPTQDASSSITGSSAFDFDADGASEVVYADELDVWVWEGGTGELIYQGDGHASGTHLEYPLVVQLDDGPPVIVIGSNNLSSAGWAGITVLGDSGRAWVPTRSVWNQHAFMPTHVADDLSVPANPTMPWTVGQGFRQNEVAEVPGVAAADVSAELHAVCDDACPDELVLRLRVLNEGIAAPPVGLTVRRSSDGASLASQTTAGLPGGTLAPPLDLALDAALLDGSPLEVVVDPLNVVEECDEADNVLVLEGIACPAP